MKTAVITGASSGLGIEYLRAVLKTRKDIEEIWIIARREEKLEKLKKECGEKIRILALDITEDSAVSEYKSELEKSGA